MATLPAAASELATAFEVPPGFVINAMEAGMLIFDSQIQTPPSSMRFQNAMNNGKRFFARLSMRLSALVGIAALGLSVSPFQGQTGARLDSKISGYWELHADSFNIPPAPLLPAAHERQTQEYRNSQFARRWCNPVGLPEDMVSYRPVGIQVGEKEVAMPSEFTTTPRHIYLDRSTHNNPDIYEPLPTGDSIGRWEGNDLLVETTGFSDKGVTQLPGGGFRTKGSVLAERYHVINDGANLLVTFTWYDSAVFSKPYTYSFYYYRLVTPPNHEPYSAGELACNASEPGRDEGILSDPTPVPRPETKH